ncbi:GIY-YIG nuclease family protein [Testudinibacter sp. TR-2022]|uniref:GIY-YIG nuclease family protein n=1 Tax=Testudinibacter sp. TR-2022 TaxID=2585029 RepID=UPI001118B009|nr:GIY-YIG nuclease family protein [Testudinibacter sp. TR-2022]TNH04712.1 GIY-YIG nuclease family protein [Pasteurellaceae bacterium Phil31]TNH05294.1 GIY-YIG nuclease family protein [Testudinibacter sp. TR-2022]TNH08991.1 GIY-YIG nuclease family protein [Testudinibacter sp. TR-2022]TNH15420.1 GIY-YIG nuclease family protein [Testudinibacter sp. TR-2022]TNH17120.1 GIY-YIG nuclease family protein [Testudinibacter sp. TR-2022]
MRKQGKNLNVFLMDGTPSGRVKCTMANWTGVSYRIPRTALELCRERDDLKQSGVYFLFGTDEANGRDMVYIGQAGVRKMGEGILYRLQEHKRNPNNDYWVQAVVLTTSNNSFGQTEISFLEHHFYKLAKECSRFNIKNAAEPSLGNITEEKESELFEFVENAKVVMGVLGFKLFEPLIQIPQSIQQNINNDDLLLTLTRFSKKSKQQIQAQCKQTAEGFIVLKGSQIEQIDSQTIPTTIAELRKNSSIINGQLQENILFKSPSYAASFVLGGHVNGRIYWKDENGKTLKELEQR